MKVKINHLIKELKLDTTTDVEGKVHNALQKAINRLKGKGHHITINKLVGSISVYVKPDASPSLVKEILVRAAQDNQSPSESVQTL